MRNIDPQQLKEQFVAWQCRIRQYSVRRNEGRPSPGMRPEMTLQGRAMGTINVVITKLDSESITREFRFMVQKTNDVQARYDGAIKLLSEYYYQIPAEFDQELTAVFSLESDLANSILDHGQCVLVFDQGNQTYHLECSVRAIVESDQKYQATYWHNHLFNPAMPGVVSVLGFQPDWQNSWFATTNASQS